MDISNINELKRDAARLAERLGWAVGQKRLYRPGRPVQTFPTWLALWEKLSRICADIDAARARAAKRDSGGPPGPAERNRDPPLKVATIVRYIPD